MDGTTKRQIETLAALRAQRARCQLGSAAEAGLAALDRAIQRREINAVEREAHAVRGALNVVALPVDVLDANRNLPPVRPCLEGIPLRRAVNDSVL